MVVAFRFLVKKNETLLCSLQYRSLRSRAAVLRLNKLELQKLGGYGAVLCDASQSLTIHVELAMLAISV